PSVSEGIDRAATARNGSPMFSPRPCGRGSGGSAGLGKILEDINLSLLPSNDSVVSDRYFLSTVYPCRSASPSAQSGIGTWWQAAHPRVLSHEALSVCRYTTARSTACWTCCVVARGIGSAATAGRGRDNPRTNKTDRRAMDGLPEAGSGPSIILQHG